MKILKKFLMIPFLLAGSVSFNNPVAAEEADPSDFEPAYEMSLYCDYVYLIDADTGQVLLDRRSDEQMYPASITKVMTSIIAIEEIPDPENVMIEMTEEMLEGLEEAKANRAGFGPGDIVSALDYIYGDLLPSGADCSRALAFYTAGSEAGFVKLMNQKAAELGMDDTHFVNTSGLHDDDHYSTCQDIAKLYQYCMQNETFMEAASTLYYTSLPTKNYPDGLGMDNYVLMYINQEKPKYENFKIPGFVGGKSGYTIEGQYTLVSNAVINGMNLILVNGHGYKEPHYPASIDDAEQIYNWFRKHYKRRTVAEKGQYVDTVNVTGSMTEKVDIVVSEDVTLDLPFGDNTHLVFDYPSSVKSPVEEGDVVGRLDVYAYDRLAGSFDLTAAGSANHTYFLSLTKAADSVTGGRIWLISLGLILLAVIIAAANLKKPRRKRKSK